MQNVSPEYLCYYISSHLLETARQVLSKKKGGGSKIQISNSYSLEEISAIGISS